MTSLFPATTIPAFSEYDGEGDACSQWERFLSAIGLEKVWARQGEGLSQLVARKCSERVKDSRSHGVRNELYTQIWSNDQGILAGLKFFRSSKGPWYVSSVFIGGLAVQPYNSLPKRSQGVFHLVTGQAVENIQCETGKYPQDWETVLSELASAAEQGRLVPRSGWGELIMQAPDTRRFHALNKALSSWLELSLDWENQSLVTGPTNIPLKHSEYAKRSLLRANHVLHEALASDFHSFESNFLPVLDQVLGRHLEVQRESGRVIDAKPKALREIRLEKVAKLVHEKIESQISSAFLSADQEAIVASWVNNLVKERPSAIGSWCRLPSSIPGIELSKNDVALSFAGNEYALSSLDRVRNHVEKSTLATLERCARGEGCVTPLALAVGEVLLEVPNRSSNLETEEALVSKSLEILDILVDRLGPKGLVWSDANRNLWGLCLGKHMYLPGDVDLSQAFSRRIKAFLDWAQKREIVLPKVIRMPYANPENGKFIEVAVGARLDLESQWGLVARLPDLQPFKEHWDLLKPIQAVLLGRHLETALPAQTKVSKPRF